MEFNVVPRVLHPMHGASAKFLSRWCLAMGTNLVELERNVR
jgi:hypothetical protein